MYVSLIFSNLYPKFLTLSYSTYILCKLKMFQYTQSNFVLTGSKSKLL